MENLDTVCKPETKWLTKDRFWNFVFWFGMSGGFAVTFAIVGSESHKHDFPYSAAFTFWVTVIGMPLLVRYFSKTVFVKDTIFKNGEGIEFDTAKRGPNVLLLVLSTVGLTALTGLFLDSHKEIPDVLSNIILFIVMFGVPSLFFIFKNCPISILFNRKSW